MPITKESHYNPCFWTAYWNFKYYKNKRNNSSLKGKPREQIVYSLNLKSNSIIKLTLRNVFFEKNAGIAKITKQDMLEYCQRNYPEEYDNLLKYYKENPSDIFIDFENHFTGIESVIRDSIENVIQTKTVNNLPEKIYLSYFIFFQILRNHNTLKQFENYFLSKKLQKFEFLLNLKHTLSDQNAIFNLIIPILSSKWTIYGLKKFRLPLSDNPVLVRPLNIMMALAPDIMIEVELDKKVPIDIICTNKKSISVLKYIDFKKRTIENSSREIIFGDQSFLEKWQRSIFYKDHLNAIAKLGKK